MLLVYVIFPDTHKLNIWPYLAKNVILGKAVEDSVSFNDFQKRVYGILGPKYYKLTDQGALKDFYDSVRVTKPNLEEDDEFGKDKWNDFLPILKLQDILPTEEEDEFLDYNLSTLEIPDYLIGKNDSNNIYRIIPIFKNCMKINWIFSLTADFSIIILSKINWKIRILK